MQIKSSGNLEKDMKRMVAETRRMYDSQIHLGKAQTVTVGPLFKGSEFAILMARKAAMLLRGYTRGS